jgi:hypothetical protein
MGKNTCQDSHVCAILALALGAWTTHAVAQSDGEVGSFGCKTVPASNLSMYKRVVIHESNSIEFRAEAYDFINHPNGSGPNQF